MNDSKTKLLNALWRIYNRPERPLPWAYGGNLPWDDPEFSKKMLAEHLDQSHGAATRQDAERLASIEWMWEKLGLQSGQNLLDITCGPGLYAIPFAEKGLHVTGVDFGPAAIEYAKNQFEKSDISTSVKFMQQDVRQFDFGKTMFDTAVYLYGQLSVNTRAETQDILSRIYTALKPGGKLLIELLDQEKVDKTNSTWWYTNDGRLWGDAPYLHLGERFWHEDEAVSVERFQILHLDTGELDEIHLCDQSYAVDEMVAILKGAGFTAVSVHPAWDNIEHYDEHEWIVYIATK